MKPDEVVDKHDIVNHQLGEFEITRRVGTAKADRVERHALARRKVQRLSRAVSPSVVWPSLKRRIAEGGAPRSSVRTWRTIAPSLVCPPVGSASWSFARAGFTSSGLLDLGELPALAAAR